MPGWVLGVRISQQRGGWMAGPEAFCLVSLHCPFSEGEVESWVREPGQTSRQVALDIGNELGQIGPGLGWAITDNLRSGIPSCGPPQL